MNLQSASGDPIAKLSVPVSLKGLCLKVIWEVGYIASLCYRRPMFEVFHFIHSTLFPLFTFTI